jgi:RNA polymerase sigma-70 factor (ECF subfamily)
LCKFDLKKLYDQNANLVYNLALNYLQNAQDAEEVTQDVFVKVYDKHKEFRSDSSLKTWIYKITINQCIDYLKSRKAQKRFGNIIGLFTQEIQTRHFDHPGVELENKEATERIFRKINLLPENQKTALILKSIEQCSQKEIAEILEVSEKSVESLLNRARKNLKELLKSEG